MQALRPFKASRAAEAALIVADAAYIAILWPSLMTFCFAISLNWRISVCTRALSSKHVSVRISRTSAAALSTFASSTEQLTSSTGVAISAQRDMTRSWNVSLPISRLMAWKRDSESWRFVGSLPSSSGSIDRRLSSSRVKSVREIYQCMMVMPFMGQSCVMTFAAPHCASAAGISSGSALISLKDSTGSVASCSALSGVCCHAVSFSFCTRSASLSASVHDA